ncbi:MAG: leucine-rich repeat protein [Clostridia bacterium]|nr:leucine-rich repeat protein [Clostridia bacterium]
MKKTTKRILCGALSAMMLSTVAIEGALRWKDADGAVLGSTAASVADDVTFKNVTGQYDTSKIREENFNSSVIKNEDVAPKYETRTVMVTLDGKPLIERAEGDVTEYIDSWSGDLAAAEIADEQDAFLKKLKKTGIPYSLEHRYNTVLNGVAIEIDTKYVADIKKMSGVDSVVITTSYAEPKTAAVTSGGVTFNTTQVYDTGIYDSSKYVEKYGSEMVVAVLDTGLDYTHAAFQDFKTEDVGYAWSETYVAELLAKKDLAAEDRSGALTVGDVFISNKVPFAYDYADDDPDVYPSYSNHGTHVAGIIGGYDESGYTDADGEHIDIPFEGVVPDCQLVICKVFTDDLDDPDIGGAVAEDIVAALEDCVKLGVDVINMSLGTSCGFTTTNDGDDEGKMLNDVYERIQDKGISLICAASNDYSAGYGGVYGTNLATNPDSGTVGSPSTFAAALSVASINGQQAPYVRANAGDSNREAYVFYEESRDIDGNPYDFVKDMYERYGKTTFEYVLVPGIGDSSDYTSSVRRLFKDANGNSLNRIAVVKRGDATFQKKVEVAMAMGAAGIIVYNNVAGVIRMNLGEIDNPIPAVSITMNAGAALAQVQNYSSDEEAAGKIDRVGTIELSAAYTAGPFMSEFSSWGPTHDLKLKPEITAHGGEITSAVPGGYGEQSGTSMASPNMAGFMALIRRYIEKDHGELVDSLLEEFNKNLPDEDKVGKAVIVNRLAMQLTMSTAGTVYDQDGLPYSPRKQGAGVARMENVIDHTQAYLWTDVERNDYRPKIEVFDNTEGVYELNFNVTNFSKTDDLTFKPTHLAMTETLSRDKLTVAEQARMLDRAQALWKVNGEDLESGEKITVGAGESATVSVTLILDQTEKDYINESFKNGMYVEGFLQLVSETAGQCDLSIPFLGFYGDWDDAPMLDYTAFEVAADAQNDAVIEEKKKKASVWETLPYTSYYNEKYILPMGGYTYLLAEDDEPMYVNEEHCAVSRYNEYYGEGNSENYMTSTQIKAVYAGLLRNARVVRYSMYNVDTGEVIIQDKIINRVGKAYSGGGSAVPANVELEIGPEAAGLVANGKYRIDLEFFKDTPAAGERASEENTYSFSYTVDYEAPILDDVRVRYYNYKDGNVEKQRIYLDIDVFDNHYAQALMLCYPVTDSEGQVSLMLATEYPTPIRDANKNGTTTVSIEVTDIYEKHGGQLYVRIDDYAVNSCLYQLDINKANASVLPEGGAFTLEEGCENVTLGIYETRKIGLTYDDSFTAADPSNFLWTSMNPGIADVKNGEIVGLKAGTTEIAVSNRKGGTKNIQVTVTEDVNAALPNVPTISFGLIKTDTESLEKAEGVVAVNAGKEFALTVETDPWYHPMTNLRLAWKSLNEDVATVDQNGNVHTLRDGSAALSATVERKVVSGGVEKWETTWSSANVTLRVQDEFRVSNFTLQDYNGVGGVVKIPTDLNIMYIGDEAFKDNDNITKIIIPSSVVQINPRAFMNCTALEEVHFVSENHREDEDGNVIDYGVDENGKKIVIDWSDLTLIYEQAFYNCPNLRLVDLSNVKTITVDYLSFAECPKLETIEDMASIGTMHHQAFMNCGFKSVDLTGLHMSGQYVFQGCDQITKIETGKFTAIGDYMFAGCSSLTEVVIRTPKVGVGAFSGCENLTSVTFDDGVTAGNKGALSFDIGARAFENCGKNAKVALSVYFGDEIIRSIGSRAFAGTNIKELDFSQMKGLKSLGADVFASVASIDEIVIGDGIDLEAIQMNGAPFSGKTVKVASGSTLYEDPNEEGIIYTKGQKKILFVNESVTEYTMPATVTSIADYAFANSAITEIVMSANLTDIGNYAFMNSKVESVDFNGAALSEIAVGAFYGSMIRNIVLPDSVERVNNYAFAESALYTFTANGLKELGNGVFENCIVMQEITLADGIERMGNSTFAGCINLTKVALPSVKSLGRNTFRGATQLEEVSFGANATTTGMYTFTGSSVETVVFNGNQITEIGAGTFSQVGNVSIKNMQGGQLVDGLPSSVTSVGAYAFYGVRINALKGLDQIEYFGDYSFYNTNFSTLNLSSALYIGEMAFAAQNQVNENGNASYTSLSIPNVISIGNYAFLNGMEEEVIIPASAMFIGEGAFASSANLTKFTVDGGDKFFVCEDGVLYRYLNKEAKEYELIAYPTALNAKGEAGEREYSILEGTLRVQAYAFYQIKNGAIDKVVLPYSVNTIGDSAFYQSGIKHYTFESIIAPVLETVYRSEIETAIEESSTIAYYKGYYYSNFENLIYYYSDYVREESPLSMSYPTNGKGYDNHIYKLYFSERTQLGIYMEDLTREIIANIKKFDSMLSEIVSWTENVTDENKAKVEALAEEVKQTRSNYNTLKTNVAQSVYFTEELIDALMRVEMKVREAKAAYGIETQLLRLQISDGSTHRKDYVVGEFFDITGLELVLVYEDYSTEIVGEAEITLLTTTALTLRTKSVEVECRGKKTPVPVTVKDAVVESETPETNDPTEDSGAIEIPEVPENSAETEKDGKGGCGSVVGGATLSAITLATACVALLGKKKTKEADEADSKK